MSGAIARILMVALAGIVLATLSLRAHAQKGTTVSDCSTFPCGRVMTITQVAVTESWTPLGMGAGAGTESRAVTSYQIGPGLSNQGMVVLGASGGAVYKKTPNSFQKPRWEVAIKLDDGGKRVITVAYEPFVREGDHVRIAGNSLELID